MGPIVITIIGLDKCFVNKSKKSCNNKSNYYIQWIKDPCKKGFSIRIYYTESWVESNAICLLSGVWGGGLKFSTDYGECFLAN